MKIINLKIRNKLLLIYVVCVMSPIILTDAIILHTVNRNSREENKKDIQFLMERIEYNLNGTIEGGIAFTNKLYTDENLSNFLEARYLNNMTYYNEYMKLLKTNVLSYTYYNGGMNKSQIFADNNTILSGGKIATVDSVREEEWYQAFQDYGQDVMLYTYYDETKKYATGAGTTRTISIIRRLDNYGKDEIEKLLKIDIDYNLMLMDVMNEKINGDIYVRNSNDILFSNIPYENSMKPYAEATSIDESRIYASRRMITGKQEWEIVVLLEETAFWSVISGNQWLLTLILLNILIPSLLIYYVGKSINHRLSIVVTHMDKVKREQFVEIDTLPGEDEIGELIKSYNLMVRKIRILIEVVFKGKEEKQMLELSKKQAELKAVQSQVNPHFLFNTLETIRMRSLIKGEMETADIIGELAVLFRKSMIWGSDFITIEEEMAFVERYLNIQRYRFGDKIQYVSSVSEECKKYYLPKLSIGTFVENACVHGIEASINACQIELLIYTEEDMLVIEVKDNGKGMDEDRLDLLNKMLLHADSKLLNESKSTGILNAVLRLNMYSDGKCEFSILSRPDMGTRIRMVLPLNYVVDGSKGMGAS